MPPQDANPFDPLAAEYDAWYDTPLGEAVLRTEAECLRPFTKGVAENGLEIGVGSGRFAGLLGIPDGVDPSIPMLRIAARSGVRVVGGAGEALPYRAGAFRLALLVTALEFVADPPCVLAEADRILTPGGSLVIGVINRDSHWGRAYQRQAEEGDPVFSRARLWTASEVIALGVAAGFTHTATRSAVFSPPGTIPGVDARDGAGDGAGFVAIEFRKARPGRKEAT